ncbi:tetratricopeptide repeat protein [Streptomyces sp. NPDC046862]|uniref:tetratricopeptide repeat protein n=1 Tax=Streptomyces sp. NPDC046862 TaxID=3154603 RepID=UPI003453B0C3
MSPRTNESAPEGERRDEDTHALTPAGGASDAEGAPDAGGASDAEGSPRAGGASDAGGVRGAGNTSGTEAAARAGGASQAGDAPDADSAPVARQAPESGQVSVAAQAPETGGALGAIGETEVARPADDRGDAQATRATDDNGRPEITRERDGDGDGDSRPGTTRERDGGSHGRPQATRATDDNGRPGTTRERDGGSQPGGSGRSGGGEAGRMVGESARGRVLRLAACAAALAVAITSGAIALGHRDEQPVSTSNSPALTAQMLGGGDLDANVTTLQSHLRAQPKDYVSWATLGLAYVEQARTKGDPARYPQAQKALKRSLDLHPDNDPALAGQAALAAARHDFKGALSHADQALEQNPYSERALSTRIDALVELGRYDDASKAADLADDRRPGIPVFTRYAYVHELRGDTKTAERVLKQALDSAMGRGDIAYVATQLGQLAWKQGDYKGALNHYARALAADDEYLPALEGRARAEAASGDRNGAIRTLEKVVASYPLPGPLVELGELYEVEGDKTKARDQYRLVDAWTSIARANGVNADLDTALADADHGDRKAALRAARAEWKLRQTVHTADALAWALHVNGRSDEAMPYARRAAATGYKDATFLYHRGMIERATGDDEAARRSLKAALDLNSGFSTLGAEKARKALKALEAAK